MTKKPKFGFDMTGKSVSEIEAEDRQQAINEVRDIRGRLGQFTLRFMMEAIYGEEYTKQVLGESGGNVLMRDIQVETTSEGGTLKTTVNETQIRSIMEDAQKGKTPEEIAASNAKAKKLMHDLTEFSPEERDAIMKFIKKKL